MKQNTRLSLAVGLAIVAPVMALTGCPGLFGAVTPSPSPTTASSPAASPTAAPDTTRKTALLTKLDIEKATAGVRSITIKNNGTAAVDLSKYVVSNEYKIGTTANDMVHARIVTSAGATISLAGGSEIVVAETVGCTTGNCVKLETGLGFSPATGVTKLGLQAGHGSIALFKSVTASPDLTVANLVDYLQYGEDKTFTHAQFAVDNKFWETKTATASAPGAAGAAIGVTTVGATGSANWKKL